jgi:DNA-binding FrmR family transcriptional regulator
MTKINDPKKQAAIALKKSQTHIKKIITMIDNDEYCIDILEQILAVNGLLKSASEKILKNHLHTCFVEGMEHAGHSHNGHKDKEKLLDEVITVINLSGKSK